jgi:putative transposase
MTPEISVLISGVIFMTKYTKEIKLAIYHEWVNDHRRGTYLSRKYGMERGGIQYLVGLIQKHGEDILDRPQQKYTADFKLAAIDRVDVFVVINILSNRSRWTFIFIKCST